MTTVTPSTSIILVDTTTGLSPYIVYFPYISTVGRIITVRDNNGYASTGNTILLSTTGTGNFTDKRSILSINQPYGFITLFSEPNGYYSVLNTFAFPTGSASAYVYNVNTNSIGIRDITTSNFEYITLSTGVLYYGSNNIGNVTNDQLTSNINYIEDKFTNALKSSLIVRRYILVGNSGIADVALGSIQYSDDSINWNNALGGTQGFFNGGLDIAVNPLNDVYVACGNNYTSNSPTNLGFIQWSTDGLIWNNSISPELSLTTLRKQISYANGIWHAVGLGIDSNTILWSSDGKTWHASEDSTNMFTGPGFNSITHGRNIWVACSSNYYHPAYSMCYSTDGSNWNPNPTINNTLNPFYDITFTGYNFVAIAGNSALTTGNIVVSRTGSNDSDIIPLNLNNEAGFIGNNENQVLVVTPSYHKYSIDYGYTWNDITDFPTGTPGKPYYDGSLWWVGINNGTSSNLYYSSSGSNLWLRTSLSGIFPSGYPQGIVSLNVSSNLNIQLISTVKGLEENLNVSSFQVGNISTGSFNIFNSIDMNGDILNISSFNTDAFVLMNILSTNIITTNTIYTNEIQLLSINISTLYASDTIYTSSFVSNYINTTSLNFSALYMSSIFVEDLSTNNINVSSISSGIIYTDIINANMVYSDIISTNVIQVSTLNFVDNSTGLITDLNASNDNLYFQGQKLLTQEGINPLLFTYQLQDTTGGIPGTNGFFTVDTDDLRTISVINFFITDYNQIALIGLFNNIGVYSIIHIINPNTRKDSIYLINEIIPDLSFTYYTFKLSHLVGTPQLLNAGPPGDIYNFYIGNIGIKPPPSSPTDTVVVHAGIIGTAFDFSSAYKIVPINIGTYISGTFGFSISLNHLNYSVSNIPAIVGSIVYYNGMNYVYANVKFSSLNNSTGAYISINNGLNLLTIGGLTLTNFPASVDANENAIYITIKFLN